MNTRPWSMRTILLPTVLLLAAVLAAITFPMQSVAAQSSELRVSNHVFTTRVIRSADGAFYAQDVLVGFERGTANFQTLTQVLLPRGTHRIAMAIAGPGGAELSRISFSSIQANSDNWTQSLEGTWRNVRFDRSGVHELIVYLGNRAVATFYFVVT